MQFSLATAIAIMTLTLRLFVFAVCLYRKYPFLIFFLLNIVYVCIYIYIFFLVHLFLSSRAERNYGWKGIEVSVAFKKSLRKERWPSCDTFHWYLVFPRNALDINETEFHFNRNDEISIRFPGWKQDPILLLTMFA